MEKEKPASSDSVKATTDNSAEKEAAPSSSDKAVESKKADETKKTKKISSTKKKSIKPLIISIAALVILAGGLYFFRDAIFGKKVKVAKGDQEFSLEAKSGDKNGIEVETSFTLESGQVLSEKDVEDLVQFEPEIEFEVNKKGSSYELKPTEELKEDEIYKAKISDEDYVDKELGWAFQTKSKFRVKQTYPRNQGTGVPTNSGIEVTFNRENLSNPEKHFKIKPEIPGTFETRGGTLIFIPAKLAEETVYQVTIMGDLLTKNGKEKLGEDFIFHFETKGEEFANERPYFDLEDFTTSLSGKKPAIGFEHSNVESSDIKIDVYRFSGVDSFISSYKESRRWELVWANFYDNERGKSYKIKNEEKILSFSPEVYKIGYQNFTEIPEELEDGYYLIDANFEGLRKQAWLQVSSLAQYYSMTEKKGIMWVNDFVNKAPVKNGKLTFVYQDDKRVMGTSNEHGLIEFDSPDELKEKKGKEQQRYRDPSFFVVEQGNHLPFVVVIGNSGYGSGEISLGDKYWDYLSTDRPVYKPADKINYWGVVKGKRKDMKVKKVSVGLYDCFHCYYNSPEKSKPIIKKSVMVDQFDTIQGELLFSGVAPGYYDLVVSSDDVMISSAPVRIMSYLKPAYQILVTPSKNKMYAGDSVDFNIKAEFFDGTPVSNMQLKYRGYWKESFEGEIELNEKGEATFSYQPEYFESDRSYYPRNLNVHFSPKLAEEGDISGTGNVRVFGPNLYVQAFSKNKDSDNFEVKAKLNEIDITKEEEGGGSNYYGYQAEYIGEPASRYSLEANIVEITYIKVEIGEYYDPIAKVTKKKYRYDRNENVVEVINGTTNAEGEWIFEKSFEMKNDKRYRVDFVGRDENGRRFKDSAYIYRDFGGGSSSDRYSIYLKNEDEKNEVPIGEKISIVMEESQGREFEVNSFLFYRFRDSISKVWIQDGMKISDEFKKEFIPSVQYRGVALGPNGYLDTSSLTVSFDESENKLDVEIKPNKEKYNPGEEIELDFEVKDKNKNGTESQLNIAAVDESLFHILSYEFQTDILRELYRDDYNRPAVGLTKYANLKDGAEQGGCFVGDIKILMASGKQEEIEDVDIGDQILTFSSDDKKEITKAVVQGRSTHYVNEYLIINNKLKVTANHRLFVNGEWREASFAKKGDELIDKNGKQVKVFSVKKIAAPMTPVYNIVVDNQHTYFAENFYVHNEEKGGGVRQEFMDVPLFKSVKTSGNGKASVKFDAPDNITSWRVTARAFNSDKMMAGQSQAKIPVTLPFFADVVLGEEYLIGDKPTLKIRVFGDDLDDEEVSYSVKSESLGINEVFNSSEHQVEVSLGELKDEGSHEVKIFAKQGDKEDTLIRKFTVLKSYFRVARSSEEEIFDGMVGLKGDKEKWSDVLFVDKGMGYFYRPLKARSYSGGLRVDQMLSSYYAKKLLSEYFGELGEDEIKLDSYYAPEGGLGIFSYADNDLDITVKAADLYSEGVYHSKLEGYFNGILKNKESDRLDVIKALYGLASIDDPVLQKIYAVRDEAKDLNYEEKLYLALALAKIGDIEKAREIYHDELRGKIKFEQDEAWYGNKEGEKEKIISATLAVLVAKLDERKDMMSLWNRTLRSNPEATLDYLEEVLVAKSALEKYNNKKYEASFEYKVGSRKEKVELKKGAPFVISLSAEEVKKIEFSDVEGEIVAISYYERGRDFEELKTAKNLSVSRKYFVDGQEVDSFKEGDLVLVQLDPKVAAGSSDGAYQVVDYLPSGLRPVTRLYEKHLEKGKKCHHIYYPSMTNKGVVYFQISKDFKNSPDCPNRTINYYARVISPGTYNANPASIQSLKNVKAINISSVDKVKISAE